MPFALDLTAGLPDNCYTEVMNDINRFMQPIWPFEAMGLMPVILEYLACKATSNSAASPSMQSLVTFVTLISVGWGIGGNFVMAGYQAMDGLIFGGKGMCGAMDVPRLPGLSAEPWCHMMDLHVAIMSCIGFFFLFAYVTREYTVDCKANGSLFVWGIKTEDPVYAFYVRAAILFFFGGLSNILTDVGQIYMDGWGILWGPGLTRRQPYAFTPEYVEFGACALMMIVGLYFAIRALMRSPYLSSCEPVIQRKDVLMV